MKTQQKILLQFALIATILFSTFIAKAQCTLDVQLPTYTYVCNACPWTVVPTVISGTSPYIYIWSNGTTAPFLQTCFPSTYKITVTDAMGSVAGASFSISGNIPVNAVVTPSGNISYCKNVPDTLKAATGSGYQWQWLKNSADINGETNSSYVAKKSATYAVSVSNGSCTATSNSVTVTVYDPAHNPVAVAVVCTGSVLH